MQKNVKLHKANLFVKGAALAMFVGVAVLVTITVFRANADVAEGVIANRTNTPKTWNTKDSLNVVANSSLSAVVRDGKYIEFTSEVTNANMADSVYITHVASYMATDGEDKDGFMLLSGNSLEYTYTPDNTESWARVNLAKPNNSKDGFKLENELHLGVAGTKTDTVYFRYYVVPEDGQTQTVNNKISYLLRNDNGENGYVASTATVAYHDLNSAIATTTGGQKGASDTSNAYVNPLGKSSFVPGVDAVTETVASVGINGDSFLKIAVIVMVVAVIVFAVCLAIYLPLRKY